MFADNADMGNQPESKMGGVTDEQGYYQVYSGKLVNQRYRIVDKIGRGVFGVVAKAID